MRVSVAALRHGIIADQKDRSPAYPEGSSSMCRFGSWNADHEGTRGAICLTVALAAQLPASPPGKAGGLAPSHGSRTSVMVVAPLAMTPVVTVMVPVAPVPIAAHNRWLVVTDRRVVPRRIRGRHVVSRWRNNVSRRRRHNRHTRHPDSNAHRPVRSPRGRRKHRGSNTKTNYSPERVQSAHDKPSSPRRERLPSMAREGSQRFPHADPVSRQGGELALNASRAARAASRIANRPESAVESAPDAGVVQW